MLALVLSDTPDIHHRLSHRLIENGFQVVNSESVMMATAHARVWTFDLIVMTETVNDALTHQVALSAERHAPFVKTLLLSDRTDEAVDELYELLPSLVSIVSPALSPNLISQIALSSVAGRAQVQDPRSQNLVPPPRFSSTRSAEHQLLAG
ncbi:hypothetical protein [uncultured Litoreibacter sp.]|uniref:hypothetical protein n=1 Tax=uncultured Litoreibacter sp. TaxID=1392394 RepID=UPI00260FA0C8|nr:hypothetical protein [uncultured Litoreibacter sp.]